MSRLRHPSQHESQYYSLCPIIALSLVLLLLLPACGRSTSATTRDTTSGATPSPAASPIPTKSVAVPGPQLVWHPAAYPPGVDPNRDAVSFSVAPGDGDIAYVCVAPAGPNDTLARTFVTRDRAATWTRGADIAVGAQPQASNHYFVLTCDIAVDANNPASALIMEAWVQTASDATVGLANYTTFDFAAHWQKLVAPQPQHFIADGKQIASWHGNIYAVGTTQIPGGSDRGVWVSADQMRTWRRLTLPDGLVATTFWLNPSSGALLMLAGADNFGPQQPYRSDDHGATWTSIATGQWGWIIAAPQAGQPWHLCRVSILESIWPASQTHTISCTADGGQTWTPPQPGFVYWTAFNPKGAGFWVVAEAGVFAVAADGAALAAGDRVYRLPPGASVWQDLGPVSGATSNNPPIPPAPIVPAYYPTSAGGVLWAPTALGWMVASYPAM